MARPKIGEPILIRLTPELLARLDRWAEANHVARAEAVRRLLTEALSPPAPAE